MSEYWWNDSLAFSARTDVGMRRSNNQDSYSASPAPSARLWQSRGHVFVVADGMGAHAAGELASKMATDVVTQSYLKRVDQPIPDALRDALLEAHDTIKKKGNSDLAFKDMGTTCDALVLLPGKAYIGHVGDSRVYRLRNHVFEQMTFDHSLFWEVKYLHSANSTYCDPSNVPKNIITRSLGPTEELEVALEGPFETLPGDVFLMCSDGLSGQFEDAELGQILEIFPPEEATETLINFANLRGGPDNITVIVARVKANPDLETLKETEKEVLDKRPPLSAAALTSLALGVLCLALFVVSMFAFGNGSNDPAAKSSCVTDVVRVVSLVGALGCLCAFFTLGKKTLFRAKRGDKNVGQLGSAPYARSSAVPTRRLCANVEALCRELCGVMKNDPVFTPDWKGLNGAAEKAAQARDANNFAESIRANFSVVNYVMRELRKYASRKKKK